MFSSSLALSYASSALAPSKVSLSDKTILIAGDVDLENARLARELLARGARVIWPTASSQDAESTHRMFRPACDVRSVKGVAALGHLCAEEVGGLDAVVVNFGHYARGQNLGETSIEDCEKVVAGELFAHVLLARTFTKILARRPNAAYILVNDTNATTACGGSLRSAIGAAELMLAQSLAIETGGHPQVFSLLLSSSCDEASQCSWLTLDTLSEAVALIVRDPTASRGRVVIENGWRECLDREAGGPTYESCL